MGILNLTPDSFWEPGRNDLSLLDNPDIDIVDLGAVSTRPGAPDVGVEEEWRRLEPVLSALPVGRRISIDTTRSEIVRRAFELCGPFIVNDISAGEDDPRMLETVAGLGLGFVAMHKRGDPRTMDRMCNYPDGVVEEIVNYFEIFSERAATAGVSEWILDPGLGFAKTVEQNFEILNNLDALCALNRPILLGPSHKRFTAGREDEVLMLCGQADIVRLHPDRISLFNSLNREKFLAEGEIDAEVRAGGAFSDGKTSADVNS